MSLLRQLRRCSAITRFTKVPCRTCYTDLTYSRGGAYEGDGKTSLTVLNRDVEDLLLIDSYSSHGFRLSSGLFVCGPAAFFPRTIMHWDVSGPWDVTVASLSLFWLLEPKPDLLIIGVGDKGQTIDDEVRLFLNRKKISVEVLDTAVACHQFNFMNSDNRNVVAAMIPNQTMNLYLDTEKWDNAAIKGRLFSMDGSSINEVMDERERRMDRLFEQNVDQAMEQKFHPHNLVLARDLKEMLERGMIDTASVKEKYPHMNIEAVMKGAYETPELLEAHFKRELPNQDKGSANHQKDAPETKNDSKSGKE